MGGLDDEEKFHDNEGRVVEIETRGEREHDKVYFLAKDVATGVRNAESSKNNY